LEGFGLSALPFPPRPLCSPFVAEQFSPREQTLLKASIPVSSCFFFQPSNYAPRRLPEEGFFAFFSHHIAFPQVPAPLFSVARSFPTTMQTGPLYSSCVGLLVAVDRSRSPGSLFLSLDCFSFRRSSSLALLKKLVLSYGCLSGNTTPPFVLGGFRFLVCGLWSSLPPQAVHFDLRWGPTVPACPPG